jgi:hypothetical protein
LSDKGFRREEQLQSGGYPTPPIQESPYLW